MPPSCCRERWKKKETPIISSPRSPREKSTSLPPARKPPEFLTDITLPLEVSSEKQWSARAKPPRPRFLLQGLFFTPIAPYPTGVSGLGGADPAATVQTFPVAGT